MRKQDGTEFEPNTLTSFQRSFGRHLRDGGKHYCLFNDKEFAKSRTLESKTKQLRQQGKGLSSIGKNGSGTGEAGAAPCSAHDVTSAVLDHVTSSK